MECKDDSLPNARRYEGGCKGGQKQGPSTYRDKNYETKNGEWKMQALWWHISAKTILN